MTKRNRLAIIFALFAFSILLTGCYRVEDTESKEPEKDHTIEQLKEQVSEGKESYIYNDNREYCDYTVSEDGKYFMFTTDSKQLYLNFIEDFDTETYEIVDTTILHSIEYYYDLYFVVTYRAIQ